MRIPIATVTTFSAATALATLAACHASASATPAEAATLAALPDAAPTGRCMEAAPPVVRVHMVQGGRLTHDARHELIEESTRIWGVSGVTLRWTVDVDMERTRGVPVPSSLASSTAPSIPTSIPSDVHVVVATGLAAPEGLRGPRPLAMIPFVDGAPTTRIMAYPLEAERLLAEVYVEDRLLIQRPSALRMRLLGRILGRVIAHEIGHFLFRSSQHADRGLMRPNHRTDALVGPSRAPFAVVAPQIASCASELARR